MSIQSSISGAIGAVGTTVAVGKALKQSDPEYQRKKQKELELKEVQNEAKDLVEQINASGIEKGQEKTEFEKEWLRTRADKLKEITARLFEADPSLENFKRMQKASEGVKGMSRASYTTVKQQQANNLAAEQAKAKAIQKQTILTNVGKWETL